jgi:alanine dehydrogenase
MIVGTVREIKRHEYRVGLTPECVRSYRVHGHEVLTEKGCGEPAGFGDAEYAAAGARVLDTAAEVYQQAEMVVKVKEPLPEEYAFFRRDLVLYTKRWPGG